MLTVLKSCILFFTRDSSVWGFPLSFTLILNRLCLFLISRRETKWFIYLSQVFDTVWPHIDCPFTPLVWLASRRLTSCDPADPSDSKHWQASRRLAIRPVGLISRVAPNPSWLLADMSSIKPEKVDMRNVENVIGQKQPCRKSLGPSAFIFNPATRPWDGSKLRYPSLTLPGFVSHQLDAPWGC